MSFREMNAKFSIIVDECIEKLRRGETVESCLDEYQNVQGQLEPLLKTVRLISAVPKVSVSEEYRRTSKARLIARIRRESVQDTEIKTKPSTGLFNELVFSWHRMWQAIYGAKKVAIPVTLAVILVLVLTFSGFLNSLSTTPTLASQCTLTILSGNVDVKIPDTTTGKQGTDGMTLTTGTRVKTGASSHVILTFFEGSTIKLEPDTEIEIQQIESGDDQSTTIVLKQWCGRTWNRVIKMADPGSHYQIDTPSATAIVRGTLFTTEVEGTGSTKVTTKEGLVSVIAQGEEVYLPANQETQVDTGETPSQPQTIHIPKSEIIISIDLPAVGSVTDPTGSSTGVLPTGFSYNQILGSEFSLPTEDTQLINIVEPVTGEYIIALRYPSEGVANFNIKGKSEGEVVFNYVGNWSAREESGWIIRLGLQVKDGVITDDEIITVETLGEDSPENVIETEIASEKGMPVDTITGDGDTEDEGNPEKPGDKDEPEDKGNPEKPGDKDEPEDKGNPEKPGDKDEPEDKGNPGKPGDKDEPENKGNPGKPGDKDEPEDKGNPGKPGDKDKPEDKGNPGKPGDKDKPEGKGQPEGKGKPEKPEDKD